MKKHIVLFTLFSLAVCIFAQQTTQQSAPETANGDLESELFGDDSDIFLTQEQTKSENINNSLKLKVDEESAVASLENKTLRIGGSIASELVLKSIWNAPYEKKADGKEYFLTPDASLKPVLDASLFFDARPFDNLKLYGKVNFGFPFEKQLSGTAVVPPRLVPSLPNGAELPLQVNGSPNFKLWELYTDFSAHDIAFFRFGKHTVKWGAGYFYSPADVININRIDPQKPTAEREGPVSLRAHFIIPKTQYNLWFYLLPDTKDFKPENTAAALKAEAVFGKWEAGLGAWYQKEKAPRLIATLSGSIIGKIGVFAEGVFAWGSDYTYYRNANAQDSYTQKNRAFFQTTAGCSYTNSETHTSVAAQYFYNGFGYEDIYSAHTITEQAIANRIATTKGMPINRDVQDAAGKIAQMGYPGQHYIALNLSQNKVGTEKFTANLFQQFAITERTGLTALSINWKIYKFASVSTGPSFTYPISSNSLTKGAIDYSLSFKLGGGKF